MKLSKQCKVLNHRQCESLQLCGNYLADHGWATQMGNHLTTAKRKEFMLKGTSQEIKKDCVWPSNLQLLVASEKILE